MIFPFLKSNLAYLPRLIRQLGADMPSHPAVVPADFFGVGVATNPDRECDEYVLEQLKTLGTTQVRLDLAPGSLGSHQERLLGRLLAMEEFAVCVHLVPDCHARRVAASDLEHEEWEEFVHTLLGRYPSIALVEIGSTWNRRKWAGVPRSLLPGLLENRSPGGFPASHPGGRAECHGF